MLCYTVLMSRIFASIKPEVCQNDTIFTDFTSQNARLPIDKAHSVNFVQADDLCLTWESHAIHKGVLISLQPDQEGNKLQRQKILIFIYPIFNHNWRNISTIYIQGVSRLQGITPGGDFLGLCDEKSSYKHVSDFGRLQSYDRFLIPVHALV